MTSTITESWTWREYVISTSIVIGLATASYLAYFDYKRRNNAQFRKNLKKQRKIAMKMKAEEKATFARNRAADSGMEGADKFPTSFEEKEKYFMDQLQAGENKYRKGPAHYHDAATCFMRAMKVYPQPLELIGVFQKSLPEPVFQTLMEMMAAEIKKKHEKYYDYFPPSNLNVKVKEAVHGTTSDGKTMIRRGLTVTRPIKAGEVIYKEKPLIAQLNCPSEDFCDYCLKSLKNLEPDELSSCDDCHTASYCSSQCQKSAFSEYHKFICPPSATPILKYTFEESKSKLPLMILRLLGRFIEEDQENVNAIADDSHYSNWDHIERLAFLDVSNSYKKKSEKELQLILKSFEGKIPQIKSFLTLDRYQMLRGKLMYNIIGITSTVSPLVPSISEKSTITSTADIHRSSSISSQIGAGLYQVTAYISHSCAPNASIKFANDASEVEVIAKNDLKVGDEIFISWIDVDGKDARTRRDELHTKFKFRCQCTQCCTEA